MPGEEAIGAQVQRAHLVSLCALAWDSVQPEEEVPFSSHKGKTGPSIVHIYTKMSFSTSHGSVNALDLLPTIERSVIQGKILQLRNTKAEEEEFLQRIAVNHTREIRFRLNI